MSDRLPSVRKAIRVCRAGATTISVLDTIGSKEGQAALEDARRARRAVGRVTVRVRIERETDDD